MAEKSRLAYQHLSYFTSLYTVARQDYLDLFRRLEDSGVREVAFCGVDEVAEVAYLSLQETGLKLVAVMDDLMHEGSFFGVPVLALEETRRQPSALLVVTSLKRRDDLVCSLRDLGFDSDRVFTTGDGTTFEGGRQ